MVAGRGGNGGNGGYDVSTTLGINPTAGGTGGTAMLIDYDISIDNQNIISGGGGGGGGSGAGRYLNSSPSVWNWIDGLGGGGGWPYGAAGNSTLITVGAASPTPTPATSANSTIDPAVNDAGSYLRSCAAFKLRSNNSSV